jgi:Zn-finger nucleic acid-binding protein
LNRINFARCSGVIVDICKGHGSWFDCDELSRIIKFIRGGGLEVSRAREKAQIEEERRQLHNEQLSRDRRSSMLQNGDLEDHRGLGVVSARGLLKLLLD